MNFVALVKIVRLMNLIFIGFCVFFGGLVSINFELELVDRQLILALSSLIFIAAFGYLWNDFCDLEIDKINQPFRVLPQKIFTKKQVIFWLCIFGVLGFLLSFLLEEFLAQFIIWISLILLFLYSKYLKKLFLVGNITIALLTAISFLLGEITLTGSLKYSVIPAIFAFLFNLAREVVKDVEDLEGDSLEGRKTIPQKYSLKFTQKIIASILFSIIFFSTLPYFLNLYSRFYFISIIVTVDLILAKWIFDLLNKENLNFSKLQRWMKIDMLFVLLSIWLGKIL